tara:strand:- start:484 stop:912 length:429 start_codon:yes stop_codon:yes gene_type:complete
MKKLLWIILFLLSFSIISQAKAEQHEWMPGDVTRVTAMCLEPDTLIATAVLWQQDTIASRNEAMNVWRIALAGGDCIQDFNKFSITLIEKIMEFERMFGEDVTGELWKIQIILKTNIHSFYSGIFSKRYGIPQSGYNLPIDS